ncbi:MAG: 1-phosphofructokinase family hexose kinase [Daejeonella sp.]|uniref:1-phosphofructokinase family hexose kinase n=1 Tax=Daejeonella sp. TaxID=2805397 RepID=UPI0027336C1F|nr:1-phosphofructokinase family hexose kinase [Daejeonella sp.]MDP3468448.1 1-phosphofructokinase family hexose kinase [Daejeonella sp.]
MSKIITITFNPAIDKSTTVAALMPEKKLRCTNPVYEPGGGGINVARAIKKLGGKPTAIYMAGGYTGKAFTELLNKEGIDSILAEIKENTRENLIVLETSTNQQYRFGMPGPSILEQEWQQCLALIENINDADFIVVSGALPPGIPVSVYSEIASIAGRINAKLIVDTSGEALREAVQAGLYLIKPNLAELSSLVGKEDLNIERVDEAAREVINKWKCEVVVVSMGAAGAMLVSGNTAMHIMPPAVKVKSTVGAGDSMVAGIVLSLALNKSIEEAAQFGVACGTAATMNPGTELCRKEDADYLFKLMST